MPVKVHENLTEQLEELYQEYSSHVTFPEFLEMVIALIEERYRSRLSQGLRNEIRDGRDKGIRPYDPERKGEEA